MVPAGTVPTVAGIPRSLAIRVANAKNNLSTTLEHSLYSINTTNAGGPEGGQPVPTCFGKNEGSCLGRSLQRAFSLSIAGFFFVC
jgi:hypothetical protein